MGSIINFGVLGCGVIGSRRCDALPPNAKLVSCFDTDLSKANAFADKYSIRAHSSLEDFLNNSKVQAVVVATINSALIPTVQACLNRGIHVLVEKPAARNAVELKSLSVPKNTVLKIGFNHRFHPAYFDLLDELKKNSDDPVMYIRARYGNGARVGFDKEWRASPELAGGGELLDQGVHVLDLASEILGEMHVLAGIARTHYWKMPVDDNSWGILSTPAGQTFSFHVSSTEWKNEFCFEVYTRQRKYVWSGLGRSYGPETLTIYKMKPEMGPPDTEIKNYPATDNSWLLENTHFVECITQNKKAWGDFDNALSVLNLVSDIYASSQKIDQKREIGQQRNEL